MRKLIAITALMFCGSWLLAQGGLVFSVRGTVEDSSTGRPVASASVTVSGKNFSTVTNADGSFVIKSDSPIDAVDVSHIGFKSTCVKVLSRDVRVLLVPVAYPLKESSIISGDPFEIVKNAMDKIKDNYPLHPESLYCFYRETVRKRHRYITVNEAVARVYKTSYTQGASHQDRTAIEKSRVIISQRRRDTLSVRMMGGPTPAANFDPVKNESIIFNATDLQYYRFQMESPTYIGDRLQFVISFEPESEAPYALYRGTLFIDRESLAFSRIELSLDVSDRVKATRMMLIKKPAGLRFIPKELSYVVNYRLQDGVFRLDYFRSNMQFNCDWRKWGLASSYTAVNELVITDIAESAVPIQKSEMFRATDILDDKAFLFLDPDFWQDYNIIEPSESLENAVKRLKKQN